MIDISKLNKAKVLAALYNASRPQGMGFLHYDSEPMTEQEATKLLFQPRLGPIYFDYLRGRVMKVDLSGNMLDPRLYDRDNGEGAALKAIEAIEE